MKRASAGGTLTMNGGPYPVAATLRKTWVALGIAALTGCELVAGIRDITLTGSPVDATTAQPDSATETDAAGREEAAGQDGAATLDAHDIESGGDARDAASTGD